MKEYIKYINKVKEIGAKDAKIIPANSIITAEWVRVKCQYGCGGYGHKLACPPFTPTPEQTRKILTYYNDALLIHVNEMIDLNKMIFNLETEIFFDGYYKAFGMGAGPCNICKKCSEFCTHPNEVRPSMEACGIDVYSTVKPIGFPINVLKTKKCKFNFYGVILIK